MARTALRCTKCGMPTSRHVIHGPDTTEKELAHWDEADFPGVAWKGLYCALRKETVPEMARRAVVEQAEKHKADFIARYTKALVEAESLRAIIDLFEKAYEELHG